MVNDILFIVGTALFVIGGAGVIGIAAVVLRNSLKSAVPDDYLQKYYEEEL